MSTERSPWWTPTRIVFAVFVVGVALRVWMLWLPNSDDDLFLQEWARRILSHGIVNIYDPELARVSAMHPPLNYYLLWASASTYQALYLSSANAFDLTSVALMVILKVPNLLADLLIAFIIYRFVRRHFAVSTATVVVCLYLFSPALIWEAAFVGQIEAIQTLPMLLAVLLLYDKRVELAWIAMTLAVLAKPQGLVIVPLAIVFSLLTFSSQRLLRSLVLSSTVALAVLSPWLLNGKVAKVAQVYANTVDTYPFQTLNAANVWALATSVRHPTFAIGSGDGSDTIMLPDTERLAWLPIVTAKQFGLMMFAVAYAFALWCIWRRRENSTLLLAAAFVCLAFFMLPTQIAERYLFPALPFLLIATAESAGVLPMYVAASSTFMLNLYLVFPLTAALPWNVLSNQKEPFAHSYHHIPDGVRAPLTVMLCLVNIGLLFWLAIRLGRRSLVRHS